MIQLSIWNVWCWPNLICTLRFFFFSSLNWKEYTMKYNLFDPTLTWMLHRKCFEAFCARRNQSNQDFYQFWKYIGIEIGIRNRNMHTGCMVCVCMKISVVRFYVALWFRLVLWSEVNLLQYESMASLFIATK